MVIDLRLGSKMKKLIVLYLAITVIILAAVIGCAGPKPTPTHTTPETTPPQLFPSTQQPTKPFIKSISVTSPVRPLANATLVAQVDAGAECSITIDYGPSGVQCLHPKIADGSGKVSWTWTVGNFRGKWEIVVKASYVGETAYRSTFFTVQ